MVVKWFGWSLKAGGSCPIALEEGQFEVMNGGRKLEKKGVQTCGRLCRRLWRRQPDVNQGAPHAVCVIRLTLQLFQPRKLTAEDHSLRPRGTLETATPVCSSIAAAKRANAVAPGFVPALSEPRLHTPDGHRPDFDD